MASLNKEQAIVVKQAKGPLWKKLLWWLGGLLALMMGWFLVLAVLKRKDPVKTLDDIVKTVETKIRTIDAEAKAKAAESAGAEKAVVLEVKRISSLEKEEDRAKLLAELAGEDY